ncbi:DNA-processing protein DprA, partial [Sphingomonas bacterium]|uniref:DNA-processing protein DprA n=1 Tax=Sphingomonas bacterium TaxID=1895847 RepID=UPI0020C6A5B4
MLAARTRRRRGRGASSSPSAGALGIDSAAHGGALEGGDSTVAVLAGAAEIAYPQSKAALH